jgi:hypothetical protein
MFMFNWIVMPLACLALGFGAGWKVHDWRDASGALKAAKHEVSVVQRQGAVDTAVAVQQQAAQDRIRVVTQTLIQKVPVYVTAQADSQCVVPAGFVRLHDAAAAGRDVSAIPQGPGESADTPSGVKLSTVAWVVAGNYGVCNSLRAELIGWQQWYAGQRAAFENRSSAAAN